MRRRRHGGYAGADFVEHPSDRLAARRDTARACMAGSAIPPCRASPVNTEATYFPNAADVFAGSHDDATQRGDSEKTPYLRGFLLGGEFGTTALHATTSFAAGSTASRVDGSDATAARAAPNAKRRR